MYIGIVMIDKKKREGINNYIFHSIICAREGSPVACPGVLVPFVAQTVVYETERALGSACLCLPCVCRVPLWRSNLSFKPCLPARWCNYLSRVFSCLCGFIIAHPSLSLTGRGFWAVTSPLLDNVQIV